MIAYSVPALFHSLHELRHGPSHRHREGHGPAGDIGFGNGGDFNRDQSVGTRNVNQQHEEVPPQRRPRGPNGEPVDLIPEDHQMKEQQAHREQKGHRRWGAMKPQSHSESRPEGHSESESHERPGGAGLSHSNSASASQHLSHQHRQEGRRRNHHGKKHHEKQAQLERNAMPRDDVNQPKPVRARPLPVDAPDALDGHRANTSHAEEARPFHHGRRGDDRRNGAAHLAKLSGFATFTALLGLMSAFCKCRKAQCIGVAHLICLMILAVCVAASLGRLAQHKLHECPDQLCRHHVGRATFHGFIAVAVVFAGMIANAAAHQKARRKEYMQWYQEVSGSEPASPGCIAAGEVIVATETQPVKEVAVIV